jgi:hypothetical protein
MGVAVDRRRGALFAAAACVLGKLAPLDLAVTQPTSFDVDGSGRVVVTTATGSLLRLALAPSA